MRRMSQDELPPAIDLGRAVPYGGICGPRAKGELREPPDKVRREVVAMLQACSAPGRKGCETSFAQVVTALGPWWKRNQDSTLPEVLADLIDRPTCHDVADFNRESFKCSRCGFRVLSIDGAPDAAKLVGTKGGVIDFGYCPNCGAEVKDDAEPNLKEN